MADTQDLVIIKKDYDRLISLVGSVQTETSELLEDELNRANVVEQENFPQDTVKMDSVVTFIDEAANQERTMKLVYPGDNKEEGEILKVSILAPVGAALIGLRVGQSIDWPLPNGKVKTMKVLSVKQD